MPEATRELAMFPLGSVLFPGMPLPLRVFEPRYLALLSAVLDQPDPRVRGGADRARVRGGWR